jgi:hypothetical protein
VRETVSVLGDVLSDGILVNQIEELTRGKAEVPPFLFDAVELAARHVIGDGVQILRSCSTATDIGVVSVDGNYNMCLTLPPQYRVSRYDRSAIAEHLRSQLGSSRVDVGRQTLKLRLQRDDCGPLNVDVFLGEEAMQQHLKYRGHPCPRLSLHMDAELANSVETQFVQNDGKASWAIGMMKYLCASKVPLLGGHLSSAQDVRVVLPDILLRNLALRLCERDQRQDHRDDVFESLEACSRAMLGADTDARPSDDVGAPRGRRMLLSMASELLDWRRSGIFELWLQDAEDGKGTNGRMHAEDMLHHATRNLESEVWGLGHTLMCPMPSSASKSLESSLDRAIANGVRNIHFGHFDQAGDCLGSATEELRCMSEQAGSTHQLLSLAGRVSSALMMRRKGDYDQAYNAMQDCSHELQKLPCTGDSQPLASWHSLALLFREPLPDAQAPKTSSKSWKYKNKDLASGDMELDKHSEPDSPDMFGFRFLDSLDRESVRRTEDLCGYLLPRTMEHLGSNSREVMRVKVGFAKTFFTA